MSDLFYRFYIATLIALFSSRALAMESMVFKQPFSPHNGWLTYGIAIVLLLIIVLVVAKNHRVAAPQKSICQLVEKKYLGNKTVVYVIDYQQRRFLLADNQHALALHALDEGGVDELG